MAVGERRERDIGAGDAEDDQRQQPFRAANVAGREHRLRKEHQQDAGDRRGDEGGGEPVPDDADMRLVGGRELLGEAALQPHRRELRAQLHDDHREGEAPEQLRPVIAPGDEQEGQPRDEPQQEAEEIGPAALGQRGDVVAAAVGGGGGVGQCAAPQFGPVPISTPSGTVSLIAGSAARFHHPADDGARRFDIRLRHLEHQLVMDLHQHPRAAEALGGERRAHPRHRPLDDVGRHALDRGVDRGALRPLPLVLDVGFDAREMGLAAEQGGGELGFPRARQRLADIGADAGEAVEIAVDDRLGFVGGDAQPAGEAPARDAVEDREVDRLGLAAGVAVGLAEQFDRGHVVDVRAGRERLLELRHVADMGGEAQLDLAVIGRHHHMAGLGDEGVADAAADLGADRDVHEIGVGRGEAAGLRAGQAVAGVDAAGARVDLLLQRVGVGRLQLGELAPIEDEPGDRHALAGQALQLGDVGRPGAGLALAAAGEAHLVEQHVAELLRGADGELAARLAANLLFQRGDLGVELGRKLAEHGAVDLDAVALHRADHRDHRPIDQLIDPGHVLERQPGAEAPPEAQRHVGVLGGIFGRLVDLHLVEGDLLLPRAAERFVRDAVVAEMLLGEIVERVAVEAAGVEVEAHHQRVVIGRDRNAAPVQDHPVELEIVADLQDRRVFEQRLQPLQHQGRRRAAAAARRTCRRRHARAGCSRRGWGGWRG